MEPVLREVFPWWAVDAAIFDLMEDAPWSEEIDSDVLNMEYFGNHSGAKFCSPLLKQFIGENGTVPDESRQIIAKIILSKYRDNWTRLWNTIKVQYSPIDNYDMTETLTRQQSNQAREQTDEEMKSNGEKLTSLGSVDSTTHGKNIDDTTFKFGFNSPPEDRNASDLVETRESGTTATSHTGTNTDVNTEEQSGKVNKQSDEFEAEGSTMHRKGNIGVTTNQKLLTDERELWKWNFLEQVYKDVDKVLALSVYDLCRV